MNKNRNYELQCLLELLAAVINNDDIPTWQREPDWGKLYKLADYHHVANVLYGPVISINSRRLAKWKDSFEERFHYSVIMRERYQAAEKDLLAALERAKIHCLELEESVLSQCYERKEQRYPVPLRVLVEPGKEGAIREAMGKIDFEERPVKGKKPILGEHYFYRPGGVAVVLCENMTFTGKKMNKYFSLPPQPFQKKKGCQYIHMQDAEDFYLYYIAWMAERYARGATEIRDVMDLWKCYLLCYEKLDWNEINKELKRMEIDWFGEMIVKLSAMWFGYIEDFGEDLFFNFFYFFHFFIIRF